MMYFTDVFYNIEVQSLLYLTIKIFHFTDKYEKYTGFSSLF